MVTINHCKIGLPYFSDPFVGLKSLKWCWLLQMSPWRTSGHRWEGRDPETFEPQGDEGTNQGNKWAGTRLREFDGGGSMVWHGKLHDPGISRPNQNIWCGWRLVLAEHIETEMISKPRCNVSICSHVNVQMNVQGVKITNWCCNKLQENIYPLQKGGGSTNPRLAWSKKIAGNPHL